ncbi:hypothetical protein, partial [Stenotrophomonas maltophilia group sp. RNC7]|uniref:hypothetical protein n=1 Tax=Stenotrophomonas maltophilia group sp. RNC7 TaxID=3071467 RepID=UPI0027E14E9B
LSCSVLYVVSQYNIQPSVDDEAALGPLLLTGCSGILQLRYRTTWIEVEEAPGPKTRKRSRPFLRLFPARSRCGG